MAGLGYKLFTAGEVLTAANVNGYLIQGVMVFADSSARSSAIGTAVAEGMVSFLQDTDAIEYYDGSAWSGLDTLPTQAGNAGKYLTTDGTAASWATITTDPTPSVFLMMGA